MQEIDNKLDTGSFLDYDEMVSCDRRRGGSFKRLYSYRWKITEQDRDDAFAECF